MKMELFSMSSHEVLHFMAAFLPKHGYQVERFESQAESGWVYGKGEIPVLLVAHSDTVKTDKTKPVIQTVVGGSVFIYRDDAPLGADDRAGVCAIVEIIEKGLKPHVLICDGEEAFGSGARDASLNMKLPDDIKYVIEMDRRGAEDAVFYECDNKQFVQYVESFGFKEKHGTFTDISILCPKWKIAGVNLSIGYTNEHTNKEVLVMDYYGDTVCKVASMLQRLPQDRFAYVERKQYALEYTTEDVFDDDNGKWLHFEISAAELATYIGCLPSTAEYLLDEHEEELLDLIYVKVVDYVSELYTTYLSGLKLKGKHKGGKK